MKVLVVVIYQQCFSTCAVHVPHSRSGNTQKQTCRRVLPTQDLRPRKLFLPPENSSKGSKTLVCMHLRSVPATGFCYQSITPFSIYQQSFRTPCNYNNRIEKFHSWKSSHLTLLPHIPALALVDTGPSWRIRGNTHVHRYLVNHHQPASILHFCAFKSRHDSYQKMTQCNSPSPHSHCRTKNRHLSTSKKP